MNESGEDAYSLDVYVSDLLAAKGMEDDPETHAELLEAVQDYTNLALINALPFDAKDKLEQLATRESSKEEFARIIEEADFDSDRTLQFALENFRNDFMRREA